ncbi:hypothetical protein ACWOFR_03910 [Carnobacterium gallinarum]|uniref:hypothetical protein n=1 Tax=Carnobacterium gallinarum TaxID=2749 RepID=UPI000555D2C8|nr:hypothetical protein [Carnobacterium gallinarum]
MMNTIYFIGFIVYFLFCQYLVEKEKLPAKLLELGAFKLVLLGVLAIILSGIIGVLVKIPVLLVTIVTLFVASVIAGKYRKVFTKMEEGNKI